jgi:UDP-N-acetylmuramate--alanine ligase
MADVKTVHFVGIGGIGMSGIARLLHTNGIAVSGSDAKESANVKALRDLGIPIFIGHNPENVHNAREVVTSTAVKMDNPEVQEAHRLHIPVMHRSKKLAQLVNTHRGITVAGTHGKTTTSSMVATMLNVAGLNPSFVIGGIVNTFEDNSHHGDTEWFVIEADESDGSLVEYFPEIAILTNIELDHMDYYRDTTHLHEIFAQHVQNVRRGGLTIYCSDDAGANRLIGHSIGMHREFVSYGLREGADLSAENISFQGLGSTFDVHHFGKRLGRITLQVPGKHNVQNSLSAVAVGLRLDIEFDKIAAGLHEFRGVQRRFQIIGRNENYTVVDDYAHHPSEIRATLSAARESHTKRIIGIFQPHRYSRTKSLADQFGACFHNADEVVITDIYGAGEDPIPQVTSELIVNHLKENNHPAVHFVQGLDTVEQYVADMIRPNDLVITLGAGDIWKVAAGLSKRLIA